ALQQVAKPIPVDAGKLQARAVAQEQIAFAVRRRPQRLDEGDVDDRAAMHSRELTWIEPFLELLERASHQVAAAAAVHLYVVILRLDPVDLRDWHDAHAIPRRDRDPLEVPRCGPRSVAAIAGRRLRDCDSPVGAYRRLRASKGASKSLVVEWLQHVVDRGG